MTGLDTNVLVRYIMQDDAHQSALASRIFESFTTNDPGFVSLVTLIEAVWVLKSFYGLERRDIEKTVTTLLQSAELFIEQADIVISAVRNYRAGNADFADCLIEALGRSAGCTETVTFDQKAAKSAGMTLITPK